MITHSMYMALRRGYVRTMSTSNAIDAHLVAYTHIMYHETTDTDVGTDSEQLRKKLLALGDNVAKVMSGSL